MIRDYPFNGRSAESVEIKLVCPITACGLYRSSVHRMFPLMMPTRETSLTII